MFKKECELLFVVLTQKTEQNIRIKSAYWNIYVLLLFVSIITGIFYLYPNGHRKNKRAVAIFAYSSFIFFFSMFPTFFLYQLFVLKEFFIIYSFFFLSIHSFYQFFSCSWSSRGIQISNNFQVQNLSAAQFIQLSVALKTVPIFIIVFVYQWILIVICKINLYFFFYLLVLLAIALVSRVQCLLLH